MIATTNWICSKCGQDAKAVGIHPDTQTCGTCRTRELGYDIPCRLRNGWCWTHNEADSMDHHFRVHPDANND